MELIDYINRDLERIEGSSHEGEEAGGPNLDAESEGWLRQFAHRYGDSPTQAQADKVLGKWRGNKTALRKLVSYAWTKVMAMQHRLAGHIDDAFKFEAQCERIYNQLPRRARW